MPRAASAKRYAQAVFEIAREHNSIDQWLQNLERLAGLAEQAELILVMESPRVHQAQKDAILEERLLDVDPLVLNLAKLLVSKRRVELIPDLVAEYRALRDEERGIVHAKVTTAVPLEAAASEDLSRRLAALTGKQIMLTTEVDPGILGGLVARIGDKVIDGSTRGRLEALRRQLAGAR